MQAYFTHHVPAEVLCVATGAIWFAGELRQAARTRKGATTHDRQSLGTVRLLSLAGAVAAALAASKVPSARIGGEAAAFAVGLAVIWCGIGLRFWAFRTLGQYFTFKVMTSPDQEVVTGGPYRVLRHPSYSGIALILVGLGVVYGNWLSVAAFGVLPLVGIIYRIHVEEQALVGELGDSYRAFAAGRKRLIPFVW